MVSLGWWLRPRHHNCLLTLQVGKAAFQRRQLADELLLVAEAQVLKLLLITRLRRSSLFVTTASSGTCVGQANTSEYGDDSEHG